MNETDALAIVLILLAFFDMALRIWNENHERRFCDNCGRWRIFTIRRNARKETVFYQCPKCKACYGVLLTIPGRSVRIRR